jgi:hypothetical protein
MVRPREEVPICLSQYEVAMHAGAEVLMEVDYTSLIVVDTQGILDEQLWPQTIHLLNIINVLKNYML